MSNNKKCLFYLFDLTGYDRGQFDSQLLRFFKGCWEAAQIGQGLHADQTRSLFICRLQNTQQRNTFQCFIKHVMFDYLNLWAVRIRGYVEDIWQYAFNS